MKIDIKSMTLEEITEDFSSLGLKKYRAEQTFRWISSGAVSFSEMSDLTKDLRDFLYLRYNILKSNIVKIIDSFDDTNNFNIQ